MKKKKSSFNLLKLLGAVSKPKDLSQKNSKVKNHQPSWMYRNE